MYRIGTCSTRAGYQPVSRATSSCINADHGSMIVILQKTTNRAVAAVSLAQWLLDFHFARVIVAVEILNGRSC